MKIRTGFVSNSSSSSFIVIESGDLDQINNLYIEDGILNIDGENGHYRFGWERDRYDDVYSKINFAYLQTLYSDEEFDYKLRKFIPSNKGKIYLEMLEKVLKEELNVNSIEWGLTSDHKEDKTKTEGYIDHQSNAYEGENTEIFDSPETLKQFLFCSKSYIQGGNDNG